MANLDGYLGCKLIPYRSSNYIKYLEEVKVKDINDLTSNIGIKKSNLRMGKTFLSFRKTLFSLLDDENFRIPLKPNMNDLILIMNLNLLIKNLQMILKFVNYFLKKIN